MHREFFLSSRSVTRVETAKLEWERNYREEQTPSLDSRLFPEGCAPTFTDVQLYLPRRSITSRKVSRLSLMANGLVVAAKQRRFYLAKRPPRSDPRHNFSGQTDHANCRECKHHQRAPRVRGRGSDGRKPVDAYAVDGVQIVYSDYCLADLLLIRADLVHVFPCIRASSHKQVVKEVRCAG